MEYQYHGTIRVFKNGKMDRLFPNASFESVRKYCEEHASKDARMLEVTDDYGNTLAFWKPGSGWSMKMNPDGFIE